MRIAMSTTATPELQLLAVSIELLSLMRDKKSYILFIPRSIHHDLSPNSYGELLYDILAAEHLAVESRLAVRVHKYDYFLIESDLEVKV
jgi:hypothetical protein